MMHILINQQAESPVQKYRMTKRKQ